MRVHSLMMVAGVAALLGSANLSLGQTIVGRQTEMSWSALYGGGPTIFNPSDSLSKNDVVLSDVSQLTFADAQAGDFPLPWTASVAISMEQTHTITGSLSSFHTISASMTNSNVTADSGIGVAGIPGSSELYIAFDLASSIDYRFEGSVFYPNGGVFQRSVIQLQVLRPWGWVDLFSTALPNIGPDASFSIGGQLEAGSYRIRSYGELQNAGNVSFVANNEYTFTNLNAVPEPSTMLLMAGAGIAAMKRRRRAKD